MPYATLGIVWPQGYICWGYLYDLLARFRQDGADLREAIEAQSDQVLYLICCATPAPNHNWEGRNLARNRLQR